MASAKVQSSAEGAQQRAEEGQLFCRALRGADEGKRQWALPGLGEVTAEGPGSVISLPLCFLLLWAYLLLAQVPADPGSSSIL